MNPTDKIHIAGHRGLVGSALVRRHPNSSPTRGGGGEGEEPIHTNLLARTHAELDLADQPAINAFRAHGKHGSMSYRE